jgi:hypothetical protein
MKWWQLRAWIWRSATVAWWVLLLFLFLSYKFFLRPPPFSIPFVLSGGWRRRMLYPPPLPSCSSVFIIPNFYESGENLSPLHGLAHLLRCGGSSRIYHHCSIELLSSSLYVPVYLHREILLDVVSSPHHAAPCASSRI